jgi:hypothetical protein
VRSFSSQKARAYGRPLACYDDGVGLFEKNELVRLLEELTKRMESIRASLANGDPTGALAAIDQARRALAGPLLSTLDRVDGATVVSLVGRERARAWAELASLESRARDAAGDAASARRADARAKEIALALGE